MGEHCPEADTASRAQNKCAPSKEPRASATQLQSKGSRLEITSAIFAISTETAETLLPSLWEMTSGGREKGIENIDSHCLVLSRDRGRGGERPRGVNLIWMK